VSPPSTPAAARHLNFALLQEAGRCHPTLPSKAPGWVPRAARRGISNVLRGGGGTTTTDYDDGNNGKVVMTAVHSDKRQARLPNDHIKRRVEEACPNHAYPARHKLKDYDMMKSFMISGSPT
jgi:hypothetical protein